MWISTRGGRIWLDGRWSRKVPLANTGSDQSASNATHQTSRLEQQDDVASYNTATQIKNSMAVLQLKGSELNNDRTTLLNKLKFTNNLKGKD